MGFDLAARHPEAGLEKRHPVVDPDRPADLHRTGELHVDRRQQTRARLDPRRSPRLQRLEGRPGDGPEGQEQLGRLGEPLDEQRARPERPVREVPAQDGVGRIEGETGAQRGGIREELFHPVDEAHRRSLRQELGDRLRAQIQPNATHEATERAGASSRSRRRTGMPGSTRRTSAR